MASIKVRLDRLEARHGGTSLEALYREMPTEALERVLGLRTRWADGEPVEGEIQAIENKARYG